MSIVPSLSDDQRLQWKKEFRALLRSCGKQQQEVAVDMARIISTSLPEPLQDNAFISSLSRFVNGRDSAFPSWFYKEESRLLPMSQAMGLQSTKPIWTLLQNITGGVPADSGLWHPAFPQVSVEIPVLVGAKPISNIAESIVHKQKRLGQTLTCWLYGAKGVGKSYAAKQLSKLLNQHRVSSCILTHPMDTHHDVQLICCLKRPDSISRDELYYRIAGWGHRELRLLFLALESTLSPVQKSRGSAFLSLVEKESRYMGGVHTAFDVIYLLQAVLTQGIPESPAHSRIVFLQYFWSHFSLHNEGLRALHLEDWAAFWAKAFVLRWPKPCDSLSYEETLQLLSTLSSGIQLNRHQALGLLQQISMSNKKARDQAIQTLSLWLSRSSEEYMLEVLLRVKLLASDQSTYFCPHIGLARRFAILGFARQSELSLPIEIVLDPHWPTLLKELCILGLSQSVLMQWLLERSDDLTFEISSTILRFAVYVPNASIESEILISSWSSTLYAETHRLFFSADPSVNDDLPVVLQEASIRYVDILPVLSMKESLSLLERIISPTIRTLCRSWGNPPLRAVQALAPLQCPPKSYAEWQEWTILPPKGVQAWEVLVSYAERGAEWAIELLSEGRGDSSEPWIRVPLVHRVSWLAQVGVRTNTLRALQICCIEFWSEAPVANPFWIPKHTHAFQDMLLRIDNIEELLSSWVQPSALAQQIVLEETTRLAYCAVWIAEYKGYLQAIQHWFTVVYEWVVSGVSVRDGLITYQQRSIPARGIREDTLRLGLQRFLLRLGQVLYDAGETSFLLALWSGRISIDDSLEQKLFRLLLERKDRHVLERWIEQAPRLDQRINEALSRNESLLRIAWRMDKKAQRRQELLTFATLQPTLPDWAFSVAQREILKTKQWPSWLSPYREEALPLIQEIFLQSAEPHRLWWGSIIHRHRPWDPVFVASLRYWLCQDPKPLERSFVSVPGFASDQTPGFSIEELLHYIRISPQFEEEWVITGLLRLWGTGRDLNPTLALLLIDQLRLRGAEASLLASDWRRLEPTVRHRLYAIWVEEASIDDLKKELDSGGVLASQAMSKLISLGDTFAIQRAKESFVEKMNGSFLRQLCSVDPQSIAGLFSTTLQKNPQELSFLLQQANSILPYLHEYAFELRLWIRKQANL